MREYFRFTSPLPPLSRHRGLAAASANRSARRAKFEEWNANFQSATATFLIVGRISIFQRLTQYRAMREDFYIPQWSTEQENYGVVAPMEIRAANFIRAPLR